MMTILNRHQEIKITYNKRILSSCKYMTDEVRRPFVIVSSNVKTVYTSVLIVLIRRIYNCWIRRQHFV